MVVLRSLEMITDLIHRGLLCWFWDVCVMLLFRSVIGVYVFVL